jgi:hypothetical protein
MAVAAKKEAVAAQNPNKVEWNSVKVFSATKHQEREVLGETITRWIKEHPGIEIIDKVVSQSSDEAFHCLAITLFYKAA